MTKSMNAAVWKWLILARLDFFELNNPGSSGLFCHRIDEFYPRCTREKNDQSMNPVLINQMGDFWFNKSCEPKRIYDALFQDLR